MLPYIFLVLYIMSSSYITRCDMKMASALLYYIPNILKENILTSLCLENRKLSISFSSYLEQPEVGGCWETTLNSFSGLWLQ